MRLLIEKLLWFIVKEILRECCIILGGIYRQSLIEQVQHYQRRYPNTIIARLDSNGSWLCQVGQEPIYIPANKVDVIDTIGAGDAHSGGVIAGIALGLSLKESIELGNQIAAILVSRRGSSNPPTQKEIVEFAFSQ